MTTNTMQEKKHTTTRRSAYQKALDDLRKRSYQMLDEALKKIEKLEETEKTNTNAEELKKMFNDIFKSQKEENANKHKKD